MPAWQPALTVVWSRLVRDLSTPSRWCRVAGHVAAVIATLMDLQWVPLEPLRWQDPQGHLWEVFPSEQGAVQQMRAVLTLSAERTVWYKRASKHYAALGLESGVDWFPIRAELCHMKRQGVVLLAGGLEMVAQGALWPAQRRVQAGYGIDQTCPYCGGVETLLHQLWECPRLQQFADKAIRSTQCLVDEAIRGSATHSGFWLRGLTPYPWTLGTLQDFLGDAQPLCIKTGAFLAPGVLQLKAGAWAASDGSGGNFSRDPRLRRCGVGLALFEHGSPAPQGTIHGGVTAPQTVNRAELMAAILLATATDGDVILVTDSSFLHRGFHRGPACMHQANADLWGHLWGAIRARRGAFLCRKIKSHMTVDQLTTFLAEGHADLACSDFTADRALDPELAYLGNTMADALAEQAAIAEAYPQWITHKVHQVDEQASLVRARLAYLASCEAAARHGQSVALRAPRGLKPRLRGSFLRSHLFNLGQSAGHSISVGSLKVTCIECKKSSSHRQGLNWAGQACAPAGFPGVQLSRHARRHRGIVFCSKCGSWAKGRLVKLARPCGLPTSAGLTALRAFAKGKCPPGLPAWPS